jgi:hypothetical protein
MFRFTVPHWTRQEVHDAVSFYDRVDWVESGKRGMKRIRAMTLCCVYYDLKIGEEYPSETICEYLRERDTRGANAMNLSTQRVGYFLSLYHKWGMLEKRVGKHATYYTRVI